MTWEQVLGALAVGVPSLIIGVLTYRRSRASDAISAQSGVASNHRAGTAQIIEGLKDLIDQLQEDNTDFRKDIDKLVVRLDVITKERDDCRIEVARLKKKYGVNDD